MLLKDPCKGCRSYSPYEETLCSAEVIQFISESKECPCLTCLIKMICENSCDKFLIYLEKVRSRNVIKRSV